MDKGNEGKALPAGADNPALPNSSQIVGVYTMYKYLYLPDRYTWTSSQ
jgi:hypothetical protein